MPGASDAAQRSQLPVDRTGSDGRAATKADRRAQLLDAAAWLVGERGVGGFTMEGLASAAGVSKALPYRHFTNAGAALLELMNREIARLGGSIAAATEHITGGDAMIAAAIGAYFDAVDERGGLLNALAGPGSPVPEYAGGGTRRPPDFLVDLLRRGYRLDDRVVTVAAWMMIGLAIAGSDSWARGDGPRSTVEPITIAAIIATIHAISAM